MNNKYFNKLTVIAVAGTMLLTTGCKKYLDQQPITDVGSEMVFQDVASTRKALAGAYSRLVGDAGFGIRLSLYYTVDTDEMQGPTGNADNDRRDIARYNATSGNAQITNPFNQLFTGIEYANICIANIPKMDMYNSGSEQEKNNGQHLPRVLLPRLNHKLPPNPTHACVGKRKGLVGYSHIEHLAQRSPALFDVVLYEPFRRDRCSHLSNMLPVSGNIGPAFAQRMPKDAVLPPQQRNQPAHDVRSNGGDCYTNYVVHHPN